MKTKFITLNASDFIPVHIAIPNFLFKLRVNGKKLSCNAILVYALLLDRHTLSFQNGWVNENGEVYFVYKQKAIATIIGKSEKTVSRYISELIRANLIQKQVFNSIQPNRIFLTKIDDRGEVSRYTMADDFTRPQAGYVMLPKSVADCKTLKGEEKLLYAVLYNRTRLSVKNKMANAKGEVYTRYTRKALQETLSISSDRLRKYMTTLIDNELLYEERVNRSQCSYLYIKEVVEKKASINIAIDGYINDNHTGEAISYESGQNRFSKGDKTGFPESQICPHNKKREKPIFSKTDLDKVCLAKKNLSKLKEDVTSYPAMSQTDQEAALMIIKMIQTAIEKGDACRVCGQVITWGEYADQISSMTTESLIDIVAAYRAAAGKVRNTKAYTISLAYQVLLERPLKQIKPLAKAYDCSNIGNFPQREYSDDFFLELYENPVYS